MRALAISVSGLAFRVVCHNVWLALKFASTPSSPAGFLHVGAFVCNFRVGPLWVSFRWLFPKVVLLACGCPDCCLVPRVGFFGFYSPVVSGESCLRLIFFWGPRRVARCRVC